MSNSDSILTLEEVAEILKISPSAIYQKLKKDPTFIPYIKVGRQYRFDRIKVLEHFGFTVNG